MRARRRLIALLTVVLVLSAGCRSTPPSPTSPSPQATATLPSLTATPMPPAQTLAPSTVTPAPLTSTPVPPLPTPTPQPALADGEDLRITILYDNYAHDERLTSEWGFSALVEYNDRVLLFDTGGSATLMDNMHLLGIDPKTIQAVVLSHEHEDHIGGLLSFLAQANQPTVYLLPSFPARFKNTVSALTNVVTVTDSLEIFPGIHTIGQVAGNVSEQALAIMTDKGSVIITGCAHPGIATMVKRGCSTLQPGDEVRYAPVALVVGGFHLADKSPAQIERVIADLLSLNVQQVCPTHCTGDAAIAMFAEAFGEGFIPGGAGKIITLPPASEPVLDQLSVDNVLSGLEGLSIDQFLTESWRRLQARDADILFANGLAGVYGVAPGDQFTDLSADYIRETQRLESGVLELLRTYDRSALSPGQRISYDSLTWYLTIHVRGQVFADYRFLVNPVWGLQNRPVDFLLEYPLESKQEAERYIARLSHLDTWVDQVIDGLERNEQAGAIPPQYVLENTIAQLDAILDPQGTGRPDAGQLAVYTNLSSQVRQIAGLSQDERQALLGAALAQVEDTFIPAYQALKDHLLYLTTIAVEDPNQWKLPGGEEYYAYLLEYYTGTGLSADEIHELGLAEVARIQADIRNTAATLGYPADISMAELNQRLAEESQVITGAALRQEYERILAAAKQAVGAYFDLQTNADVVFQTDPDGPPAYYASPPPGSGDPGEMRINLSVSPLYANYNELVLVHHETIPGHHTQLALAQELDLPGYQRFYSVSPYMQDYDFEAYVEGWAWYAEILAWEMGLYDGDPLANLGRLRLHLLRTMRLVVDTGIHAKGWTLDEAAAYLEEVTGMPQSHAGLTRYLVNPGYACGYNVGVLKMLEMRRRAVEKLGDRFDIKEFHNIILGNGIVPISVLEGMVDDWIDKKLGQPSVAGALAQFDGLPLDQFLKQSYRQLQLRDPDTLFVNGLADQYGVANDRFTDMSDSYLRQTQQLESGILDLLRAYDRSALSPDQQISYDAYEWYLDDRVRGHQFTYYDYPINPLTIWGKQNWLVDFMVNYQPIADKQDAQDYIARLSQIDTWAEQLLEGLKLREQAGAVPPRYILEESISQIEGHLHMQGPDSFQIEEIELYTSFRDKLGRVEGLSAPDKQALADSARAEIERTFVPAFLELRDYLLTLEAIAGDTPGVHRFSEGQAYYAYLLRHQTGTDVGPGQVHELGLSEVTRIQAEIRQAAAELGYPPDVSLADLDERLSAHSDPLRGDVLLAEYGRLIAEVEKAAGRFFDRLPSAELVIEREPFGSGIGYYLPPPLDGSGPGVFYTNPDYPIARHIIPSFVFHETVPGHHLQGALARELNLSIFSQVLDLNGYTEGWAVYAERLAWEMGLYETDPLGNLGRLQFDLSRAARLVVDTGIHAKGWSRAAAAAYWEEATGQPAGPAAMNRFIILPGQGCGYTVGMLEIVELRQRAMDRIGDEFDIKEFHTTILSHGSMPLELLERVVNEWIESKAN